jgi:limonene 1,2-monooxygenase
MISFVNDSGFGAIGTPDMVTAQIDRLWKQSNGGFGAYLMLAHNWANFDATRRSYDLVARHVFPRFQGQHASTMAAAQRARAARPELAEIHTKAVEAATHRYQEEAAHRAH